MLAAGGISYSVSVRVVSAVVTVLEFGSGYGNLVPRALCIRSEEQGVFVITGSVDEESRSQKYVDVKLFRLDAGNILFCSGKPGG